MLVFVGVGHVKSDMLEQALAAVNAFMPKIQKEEGTLEYIVYQGTEDPTMLVFYEIYQDEAAHAAHGNSEGMAAFREAFFPCMAGEPMMGLVKEVASIER